MIRASIAGIITMEALRRKDNYIILFYAKDNYFLCFHDSSEFLVFPIQGNSCRSEYC